MSQHGSASSIGAACLALIVAGHAIEPAHAQSLADVARREAERRKQVTSGRVITNDDLAAVDQSSPPPTTDEPNAPPPPGATPAPPEKVPSEKGLNGESAGIAGRPKRDEQYWRARAKDIRGRLAKLETEAAGAKTRLSEFDAGPKTAATARERDIVAATLAKLEANAGFLREELAGFERRARAENVPIEWTK